MREMNDSHPRGRYAASGGCRTRTSFRGFAGRGLAAGPCPTVATGNITIYIPPELLEKGQVLQTEGTERAFVPSPAVRLLPVEVKPPSLSDQVSDLERLAAAMRQQHGLET